MAKRRPNGDGMVRKREDGRWEGRIVVGHKRNGAPIYRYIYGRTQKELLSRLHQRIDEYDGAELTEDSNMTLGKWLDRWLADYAPNTSRPGTLAGYRTYAESYIKPRLGDKRISSLTSADIQKFYTKLKKEGRVHEHPEHGHSLSDATICRVHSMLRLAMAEAEREHLIPSIPLPKQLRQNRTTSRSAFSTRRSWKSSWKPSPMTKRGTPSSAQR